MPQMLFRRSAVNLDDLLIAREERAARQAAAVAEFAAPLVSITMVIPGPWKDGWLPRRLMEVALNRMDALIRRNRWPLLSREVFWRNTGPEALYVLDLDAEVLKSATTDLEERHPLGRLWDLDVITTSGTGLSRLQMGRPARRCLLCSRPARECGRSRRHSLPELRRKIRNMVDHFDCTDENDNGDSLTAIEHRPDPLASTG